MVDSQNGASSQCGLALLAPHTPPELIDAADRLLRSPFNRANQADRVHAATTGNVDTPPEVVQNPKKRESTTPILDRYVREIELDTMLEDGVSYLEVSGEGAHHGSADDDEYDDLIDVEREDVGLKVYRCQWERCGTELPDAEGKCVECQILLCESHSYRCHRCDLTPFCARHWEPVVPGHKCTGMQWVRPEQKTQIPDDIMNKAWKWRSEMVDVVQHEKWNELHGQLKKLWNLPIHTHAAVYGYWPHLG